MNNEDDSLDNATKKRFQQDQLRIESGLNSIEEYAAEIAIPRTRMNSVK